MIPSDLEMRKKVLIASLSDDGRDPYAAFLMQHRDLRSNPGIDEARCD